MRAPKVRQMMSPRSGGLVDNQFMLYTSEGVYFQSYNTLIAFESNNGEIFLDEGRWDFSRTTSRYRNIFLGLNTQETKSQIESGEIKLIKLN